MMLKSYYWVLYTVMISTGAYFLADITSLAIRSHLEDFLAIPIRASDIPDNIAAIKEEASRRDYRPIIHRNIFNSRKPKLAPIANPSAGPLPADAALVPVSLPPLNMNLVGTVVVNGFTPYAVIREPKKKEQTIYRQGDAIAETAKIVEINRNKVTVQRNGGKEEILELTLDPKKQVGKTQTASRRAAPTPSPKPNAEGTIRQVSDNQWLLDRRELDNAMKNLPQLLTKARIIPNFKEGKPDGFRIFAIARNSLYAKIGLQNGDILHRINNVEVKNPQNFMKVMEQLKDESNINIDLVRNNQQQTFNYEIR